MRKAFTFNDVVVRLIYDMQRANRTLKDANANMEEIASDAI
jgi:hypothetical protein